MSVNFVYKRHTASYIYYMVYFHFVCPMPFAHLMLWIIYRIECVACDCYCEYLNVRRIFFECKRVGLERRFLHCIPWPKICKMFLIHPAMYECKTVTGQHFIIMFFETEFKWILFISVEEFAWKQDISILRKVQNFFSNPHYSTHFNQSQSNGIETWMLTEWEDCCLTIPLRLIRIWKKSHKFSRKIIICCRLKIRFPKMNFSIWFMDVDAGV